MEFQETPLKGAFIIRPELRKDDRGYFYRSFCKNEFSVIGHEGEWVQMNHSFTAEKGSVRGMHFQIPPYAEIKMLRCVAGRILDVIIDIRENSPTFLQWFGVELSTENRQMLYIPRGFAHGFQTLTDNCELVYNHSEYYTQGAEGGIRYDDPLVNIEWPMPVTQISPRDTSHPLLTSTFTGIKI